jgi:two-component sensor histidine kinase
MTLVLALLPLGVLSVVQTQVSREQLFNSTIDGIEGASLEAVQPQIDLIRKGQTTVQVLARNLSLGLPDNAACTAQMQAVAADIPQASFLAYIPASGLMTCSSTGEPFDFSGNEIFARMITQSKPTLVYNPRGPVSGVAVIGISHPVVDAAGTQIGVVAVSIPNQAVKPEVYSDDYTIWQPSRMVAFTEDGVQLAESDGGESLASLLPAGMTLDIAARLSGRPVFVTSSDGQERVVSVTNVADDLYLMAIWQRDNDASWAASALAPYLLPALTWAAALIAAALASGRLVVRHVRSLSRAMMAYSEARARVPVPDITEAPTEIQKLHSVYDKLIRALEHDEAELQNLLVDKEKLLREVHHRSGNSLQIIASVMRMYRREARDPALRSVLDGLINRVIALSSTHTSLYGLDGRRDVPMDEVLSGVIRRLKEIHGIALGSARKEFAPIRLPVETAVPLALALAETVGCHFSARTGMEKGIKVTLSEEGDDISLLVEGPVVPELMPETTTGMAALPRRMLMQFAGQLRGRVTTRIDGGRSFVELVFPRTPF